LPNTISSEIIHQVIQTKKEEDMEIKSKWAFGVILMAVLVFLALNTFWTRGSLDELVRGSNQQKEALENITNELSSSLPFLRPIELKVKTLQAFVEAPPNVDSPWLDADTWTPTMDIEIYQVYAYQPGEIDIRWQFATLSTNPKCNEDDDITKPFLTEGLLMAQSLSQGFTVDEIRANRHDVGNTVDFLGRGFIKIPAGTTLRVHFGCSNAGLDTRYPTAWFHIYYREVSGE
jgi:hypothetical protein